MKRFLHGSGFIKRLQQEPLVGTLLGFAGDSAVYLAGGLLVGLGNVILIPLYTRCLAPREFGIYALIDVVVILIVTVSTLRMDVSYLKWFADLDRARRGELLGSVLLAGLAASFAGGAVLSLVVANRESELWLQTPSQNYAWFLLPIVVLENVQVLFLADLRAHRRAALYSMAAICRLAGLLLASYYLLVIRQSGLTGLFLGRLIGDLVCAAFLTAVCLRSVVWRFSWSLLGPMVRFGLPLIWCAFAAMLQDASGRYFLTHYRTLEQVGQLGAAIKIGAVFQMLLCTPFGVAWSGLLFQIVKERDAQIIYSKIFSYAYVLALSMALVLTIFAPTLFRVFTAPAYYSAIVLLPLVLLVRAMNVMEQPAATGIYLAGHTGYFAAIYTAGLGLNLLLLYELVPRYGAIGVVWAWFLGSASVPLLMFAVGQRLYPLALSEKLLLIPIVPWALVFLKPDVWDWHFSHFSPSRLWFQIPAAVLVTLGAALLLLQDFRGVRRKLAVREVSE
jgi:O-antigen/teichoic acid export membrane protein